MISFDHGDGTIDPRSTSFAYYESTGSYDVTMAWELGGVTGSMACGTVHVVADDGPDDFDPADYVGQILGAAQNLANANGLIARVVRIDDDWLIVTQDFRTDRVNFELDNGIVTVAKIG